MNGCVPELNGSEQSLIQTEKDRQLDQDRHAAAGRIHTVGFIERHDFLVHELLVVLVLFPDGGHQRLELLHLFHGGIALGRQGPEHRLDQNGQQNDRHAPVVHIFVEKFQKPEQTLGNDAEHSQIDAFSQLIGNGQELRALLGTQPVGDRQLFLLSRREHASRALPRPCGRRFSARGP